MCEIANELSQGNCIELYTTSGIFFGDEFTFSDKIVPVQIDELVIAQSVDESKRWEIFPSPEPCFSVEPDSCKIWRLITIPEGYEIVNLTGDKFYFETCPKGGFYDDKEGVCKFLRNDSLNIIFEIVDIETDSSLTVESWYELECDP